MTVTWGVDAVASRWGRKLVHLPDRGVLLVSTDLHGNWRDYERLKALYRAERAAGREAFLLFTGDMVHGPSPDLLEPGAWPDYLGTPYVDESARVALDYRAFSVQADTFCLLGNHEHAHVGGPRLGKFYDDEAAVLDAALGPAVEDVRAFFAGLPLVAVAPCGAVFTHASPMSTEPNVAAFEQLRYGGFENVHLSRMVFAGTVGGLLWSRQATPGQARSLLRAVRGSEAGFVAFGHDVVREGYDKTGAEQICVSTSYGLFDEDKVYLRLELDRTYRSVHDLRDGVEIRKLWP